ncbi:transposase [Actinomyces sp. 594]|nr:transposase [Actinomyces sp. 594]
MTRTPEHVHTDAAGGGPGASASVFAGVDTHADTHHAAVVDALGYPLADRQFPSTPAGHQDLYDFITSHGRPALVAVEGTGSYGRTLTSHLLSQGLQVREALRPGTPKRPRGKTDTIDAYRAARTAAADDGSLPIPKTGTGTSIAIRAANNARRQAVRAQGDTMRQLKDLLITAPTSVREDYRGLDDRALLDALAALDQPDPQDDPGQIVRSVLGCLARRWLDLDTEINQHTRLLDTLTLQANPALRATKGVGTVVAAELLSLAGDNPGRIRSQAALAAMTGTCPIPASSGRTNRHRPRPRRRPPSQLGHPPNRPQPRHTRPHHTHLHPTPDLPRQDQTRSHQMPQKSHHPRDLQNPDQPPTPTRPHHPAPTPQDQRHHPHPSRHRPTHLARPHQRTRTRQTPRPRPRHHLRPMAHHRLTHIGASGSTVVGNAEALVPSDESSPGARGRTPGPPPRSATCAPGHGTGNTENHRCHRHAPPTAATPVRYPHNPYLACNTRRGPGDMHARCPNTISPHRRGSITPPIAQPHTGPGTPPPCPPKKSIDSWGLRSPPSPTPQQRPTSTVISTDLST